MKILIIHAEKMWWKVTKPVRISLKDEIKSKNKENGGENILVAFTCVEREDEDRLKEKVSRATDDLVDVAGRVKVDEIILYPYAHLSDHLSKASSALRALKLLEKRLEEKGIRVKRAPFGYYKEFMLHCKGHPLSESLRVI